MHNFFRLNIDVILNNRFKQKNKKYKEENKYLTKLKIKRIKESKKTRK